MLHFLTQGSWLTASTIALLALTPFTAADGSIRVRIYSDKGCKNFIATRTSQGGGKGCFITGLVQTFESVILESAGNVNSVTACQRGFGCGQAGANELDLGRFPGICLTGNPGSQYDKFEFCSNSFAPERMVNTEGAEAVDVTAI